MHRSGAAGRSRGNSKADLNPISPRVVVVQADAPSPRRNSEKTQEFPLPNLKDDAEEKNTNVALAGASSMSDGKKYEFQRDDSMKWELEEKGKRIKSGIRRWMLLRAAFEGKTHLVKQCLKEGVPVDYRDSLSGMLCTSLFFSLVLYSR